MSANPLKNSKNPYLLMLASVWMAHGSCFLFRVSVPTMGMDHDEQVQRWQAETLTDAQRGDLEHLVSHLQRLHTVIAVVLTLADELKAHTI
jgi:hypothetical protein